MAKIHNLDEQVQEYFEFIVKGHKYKFRHMTTEEIEELRKIEDNEEKSKEFLYSFITKEEETAPEFPEVAKDMITPHWIRFREMIKTEFGG